MFSNTSAGFTVTYQSGEGGAPIYQEKTACDLAMHYEPSFKFYMSVLSKLGNVSFLTDLI